MGRAGMEVLDGKIESFFYKGNNTRSGIEAI